ncbi:unnamed protein product [Pseudo-nitzschia multistriata]|uniref:Uncharacterized protein n=1 Tax=Pseudo-nitzschia multistriata TaxID=183589 RepID=A0A448ZCB1_9STRA|nr:unnamed protein product [Pseudo-nitzschia multistriata]
MGKRKTRTDDDASSPQGDKIKSMDARILAVMFELYMDENFDATLTDIASQLGVQERTKSFRERWTVLKNQENLIGPSETGKKGCFQLTQAGVDRAATPEYREMLKDLATKPKTNKDHQERTKKYLKKPKSSEIFDLLLVYGSLSPDDLSALVGQNRRSHGFHYSLQELRRKGLVEHDPAYGASKGKKLRLADKAFLKGSEDRPIPEDIDTKNLAKGIASGQALIESRKQGGKKKNKISKDKMKKEEPVEEEPIQESNNGDVSNEEIDDDKDEHANEEPIQESSNGDVSDEEIDNESKIGKEEVDVEEPANEDPNQESRNGNLSDEDFDNESKIGKEEVDVKESANEDPNQESRNGNLSDEEIDDDNNV